MCNLTVFRVPLRHQFGGVATPAARPIFWFLAHHCSCTLPTSLLMFFAHNITFSLHFKEKRASGNVQFDAVLSGHFRAHFRLLLLHFSSCKPRTCPASPSWDPWWHTALTVCFSFAKQKPFIKLACRFDLLLGVALRSRHYSGTSSWSCSLPLGLKSGLIRPQLLSHSNLFFFSF